jgi:hypothetical protein
MRTYPCFLKSKETGNVYRFDTAGFKCTVISIGPNGALRTTSINQTTLVGYNSEDRSWCTEVPQEQPYDPTQAGDKEDDI